MAEIGKVERLFKGYFSNDKVSDEVQLIRLEKCNSCPLNSKNKKDLDSLDSLRKSMSNTDFCTTCKCPLNVKTSSPYEECPGDDEGENKLWFKKIIKTRSMKELELINPTDKEIAISYEAMNNFTIDVGDIYKKGLIYVDLIIKSKEDTEFTLYKFIPTCFCTEVKFNKQNNNEYLINLVVDPRKVSQGFFSKTVEFIFSVDSKNQSVGNLKITGFKLI